VGTAIRDEPVQLVLPRDPRSGARRGPDAAAELAVGGLARGHHIAAGGAERRCEAFDLGGLAAAVEALEDDQLPAVHAHGVNRP